MTNMIPNSILKNRKENLEDRAGRSNFIRDIIDADLAEGKYDRRIVTRFPPEPNGYLHIGHAKSICLNFGIAADYGGRCNLRYDDTNPINEDTKFVDAIQNDVKWLSFDWGKRAFFASDFFKQMYEYATMLIKAEKAYVDSLSKEEISEYRGTPTEAGKESPYRTRSVEENLDLFARMRAGEFEEEEHVLRAKIDMTSPNILMRDPLLYRIRHVRHHRTGNTWCIYPMYDFAHCLEDAFEGVSHSICTLEFEINRPLYNWVLDQTAWERRPKQIEFARMDLSYTVLSKRYLSRLVEEKYVNGWDDPRMPTIAGLRRRGVTPEAIHAFCDMIGVAKANSTVDLGKLEYCLRNDLNQRAPRVMCVLRPLKVVIINYPEDHMEMIDAPYWPHDVPNEGSRKVPFSRVLYIEHDDFREDPPNKWFRLAPGREIRLRYAYVIKCTEVIRDEATGEVTELRCTYDPKTRHGTPLGRKVKGTLHWVSAAHALPAEVRLYDRLFVTEKPGNDPKTDFISELNPDSLVRLESSRIEPSVREEPPGSRYQFERHGYFCSDPFVSTGGRLVFNRIVSLRDSWTKISKSEQPDSDRSISESSVISEEKALPKDRSAEPTKGQEREAARKADPCLAERFTHYTTKFGLDSEDADRLTGTLALTSFFDDALAENSTAPVVARWIVNELLREIKNTRIEDLPFTGTQFGVLVSLVDGKTISSNVGKEVLAIMMKDGGDPAAIVKEKELTQVSDEGILEPVIDEILSQNPDHVARYKAGKIQLLGFFIGQVMKATGGAANPGLLKELLEYKLSKEHKSP